jgi:hypothetical protein
MAARKEPENPLRRPRPRRRLASPLRPDAAIARGLQRHCGQGDLQRSEPAHPVLSLWKIKAGAGLEHKSA